MLKEIASFAPKGLSNFLEAAFSRSRLCRAQAGHEEGRLKERKGYVRPGEVVKAQLRAQLAGILWCGVMKQLEIA